jgi:two-component system OmpR family response regulator
MAEEIGRRHLVVLVADDDDAIRALLAEAIGEEPGLHVLAAADGAQALSRCEHARPSLVLVDVNMPGVDGIEVIDRLRAAAPTTDVPIVAMSAGHNRERALAAGADAFVEKPFELDSLVDVILSRLAGRPPLGAEPRAR